MNPTLFPPTSPTWTAQQSAELYGLNRWGNDYFGLSDQGQVVAKTLSAQVPLMSIVEGMAERDLQMPVLLRIENILDAQLYRFEQCI